MTNYGKELIDIYSKIPQDRRAGAITDLIRYVNSYEKQSLDLAFLESENLNDLELGVRDDIKKIRDAIERLSMPHKDVIHLIGMLNYKIVWSMEVLERLEEVGIKYNHPKI